MVEFENPTPEERAQRLRQMADHMQLQLNALITECNGKVSPPARRKFQDAKTALQISRVACDELIGVTKAL